MLNKCIDREKALWNEFFKQQQNLDHFSNQVTDEL